MDIFAASVTFCQVVMFIEVVFFGSKIRYNYRLSSYFLRAYASGGVCTANQEGQAVTVSLRLCGVV